MIIKEIKEEILKESYLSCADCERSIVLDELFKILDKYEDRIVTKEQFESISYKLDNSESI